MTSWHGVTIHTGLGGGENAADVPRSKWQSLVRTRRTHCQINFREDCGLLVFFIEDGAKNNWLGFESREHYIREGLGLDPDLVPWAIDGLKKLDPDKPVSFNEAVVLGGRGAPLGNNNAAKEREIKGSNTTIVSKRGATYTLARLRRDRPDLAQRVTAGELTAHAAAILAGFRKGTWTAPVDADKLAVAIAARYPHHELRRKGAP